MESSMAIQFGPMDLHPETRRESNLPLQQFPDLLPEIIIEILSRLPVKSLLRFRSVSKSWRSIIDNPKFTKTHHDICSKNAEIAHHRLIFVEISRRGPEIVQKCHLSSVFNVLSVNPTELDYPMKHPEIWPYIVGSVNGLICIVVEKDTFLWNPTTRISKILPNSGFKLRVYAFGYDESTDDYRVVGFICDIGSQHSHNSHNVMVYSLRTDCWRRIGNFPSGGDFHGCSMFVNGAVHWATGSNFPFSWSIVSLDLAKETYGEVAQPIYGDGDGDGEFWLSLGAFGECLSVLCDYGASHVDVWMMKEYGVRESWTKVARMPKNWNDPVPDRFIFPWLVYISKNGEILLRMGARMEVYDPKTNSLWHSPDTHNLRATCVKASVYIESLVSPLIQ